LIDAQRVGVTADGVLGCVLEEDSEMTGFAAPGEEVGNELTVLLPPIPDLTAPPPTPTPAPAPAIGDTHHAPAGTRGGATTDSTGRATRDAASASTDTGAGAGVGAGVATGRRIASHRSMPQPSNRLTRSVTIAGVVIAAGGLVVTGIVIGAHGRSQDPASLTSAATTNSADSPATLDTNPVPSYPPVGTGLSAGFGPDMGDPRSSTVGDPSDPTRGAPPSDGDIPYRPVTNAPVRDAPGDEHPASAEDVDTDLQPDRATGGPSRSRLDSRPSPRDRPDSASATELGPEHQGSPNPAGPGRSLGALQPPGPHDDYRGADSGSSRQAPLGHAVPRLGGLPE
jgi:hypothetical protein